jgi:hypothetical protein
MSKAVAYTGADPTEDELGDPLGEWQDDADVADVTVAGGVAEIKNYAFRGCKGLTNLSFLKDSAITTVRQLAFSSAGIITLQGMERVRKIGHSAFCDCTDLRTIEGLACEVMSTFCFAECTLLQSMKGWPASMTVIPLGTFLNCTGMTTVDCDLSHVTSIGVCVYGHAFAGCTSLLPPSLSAPDADPAAVLAYLKRKSKDERTATRYATYACLYRARKQEGARFLSSTPSILARNMAKLPPDMNRLILEFKLGVVALP